MLFYKRRTSRPLGGKSYDKIEAAKASEDLSSSSQTVHDNAPTTQLPTPPYDGESSFDDGRVTHTLRSSNNMLPLVAGKSASSYDLSRRWPTPQSDARSSPNSSPLPPDEMDPPSFEDAQFDDVIASSLSPLGLSTQQFDFPDPSSRSSPTSSNEAEPDLDRDQEDWQLDHIHLVTPSMSRRIGPGLPLDSDDEDMNPGPIGLPARARRDSLSDVDL